MQKLMQLLGTLESMAALDVATRHGEFIRKLKKGLKKYQNIIGVDNNSETINSASEQPDMRGITFRMMNAEQLKFQDSSFDLVSISNSLHHIRDYTRALQEMRRIVKPSGVVIINEMYHDNQNAAQQTHTLLHQLSGEVDMCLREYHAPVFSRAEIIAIFEKLGLTTMDIFDDYENSASAKKKLEKKITAIRAKIEKTVCHSRYAEFVQKSRLLQQAFQQHGIERCTQLVLVGIKP